uniref:Uncharacterized protein n=1 Tax=Arundo donax TaxID=35708 RepID=A0A0A9GH88_ARUDO
MFARTCLNMILSENILYPNILIHLVLRKIWSVD